VIVIADAREGSVRHQNNTSGVARRRETWHEGESRSVIDRGTGLQRELVPFLPAFLRKRAISELFLVSLPLVKWVVSQLHVNPLAIHKDDQPDSGPECDHQFDSAPADAS